MKMKGFGCFLMIAIVIKCEQTNAQYCHVNEVKDTISKCSAYRLRYSGPEYCNNHAKGVLYSYLVCKEVELMRGARLPILGHTTKNFTYIKFEHSTLPVVPVGVFTSFASVKQLYLNHCKIRTIETVAFSGMTSLEELYLEENNIAEISKGTLNYLGALKTLDLSHNNLSQIEDNALHGLLALKKLKLNHNLLDIVTPHSFGSLSALELLDLSQNRLTNIQKVSFANMHHLIELLLNNNLLKNDVLLTFENLNALRILDASFNKIVEVDFERLSTSLTKLNYSNNAISVVKNWDKLKYVDTVDLRKNNISAINSVGENIVDLYLGWNNLKSLNSSLFNKSNALRKLDLSHNSIESIMSLSFQGLSNLENLWLNKNQLKYLPIGCFRDLKSLEYLYLSHNLLTNLEFGTFAGLSKLKQLWIDYNSLTNIHENSFYIFSELTRLYFNDNQINSIEVQGLLLNLKNLDYVCLTNNNWTCNALLATIQTFKNRKVTLCNGQAFYVSNVDGITCTNEKVVDVKNTTNLISDSTVKTSFGTTLEALSDEKFYNSTFYKYFDRDFKNSSFYRFLNSSFQEEFKNYLDNQLCNSKLVKYLDTSFENSSFYNFFNKEFSKNLQKDLRNSNLFKYFDQDFLNSSFIKYFNEDFKKSVFFKGPTKENVFDLNSETEVMDQSYIKALGLSVSESSDKRMVDIESKVTIFWSLTLILLFLTNIMFLIVLYRQRAKKLNFSKTENIFANEANLELL